MPPVSLFRRIATCRGEVLVTTDALSRRRPGSLSTQQMQMYTDFVRVLDKAEATMQPTPDERVAIDQQRRDYKARIALQQGKTAFFRHPDGIWVGLVGSFRFS